jgi:hypothetical protein
MSKITFSPKHFELFLKEMLSLDGNYMYHIKTITDNVEFKLSKRVNNAKVQKAIYKWLSIRVPKENTNVRPD